MTALNAFVRMCRTLGSVADALPCHMKLTSFSSYDCQLGALCRLAVCAALKEQQTSMGQALPPQSPTGSLRALSQRRAYMDSGWLAQDQAVIAYMKKLELHK